MPPDTTLTNPVEQATYTQRRIASLTRTGSVLRLRDEAFNIRQAVSDAIHKANDAPVKLHRSQFGYQWARIQLARAEAYEKEADRIEAERPAGEVV